MQAENAVVPPSRKGENVPYLTMDLDVFEVLPQPDNRVTIAFYGVSDRYPRLKINKWPLDRARALMAHVTNDDISQPTKKSLPVRVYYTTGKEKTPGSGQFWEDVEHVRPR
jgi:hypothetical protein